MCTPLCGELCDVTIALDFSMYTPLCDVTIALDSSMFTPQKALEFVLTPCYDNNAKQMGVSIYTRNANYPGISTLQRNALPGLAFLKDIGWPGHVH